MKVRYLMALCGFCFGLGWGTVQATSTAYEIEADSLTGELQSLQAYKGKPLVLNFWATWCPPCVKEMPELEDLSQKYPEVQFVGLAIDTQRNVKRFLEQVPVSYSIYVTGHRGVQIMKNLGNRAGGIPYTLILHADGSVAEQVVGQINPSDLEQVLRDLKN